MVKEDSSKLPEDGVIKRLNAIIRLMMDKQFDSGEAKRQDQIMLLYSVGLTPTEIGQIVDKPSKDVSSIIKRVEKEDD